MIGRERRGEGDTSQPLGASLVKEEKPGLFEVPTPLGKLKITRKKLYLLISIAIFVVLLNISIIPEKEANRCFAILLFCTILWATEVSSFSPQNSIILTRLLFLGDSTICYLDDGALALSLPAGTSWT